MLAFEDSAKLALENVTKWGDTDIFPYPLENTVLGDLASDAIEFLKTIHSNLDDAFQIHPIWYEKGVTLVGYNGLRVGTTIDPMWNAYLLALCIGLGKTIEQERKYLSDKIVHSYRMLDESQDGRLFEEGGYSRFLRQAEEHSEEHKYVLVTDIADFYPRIYHHKIENALDRLSDCGDYPSRIMKILDVLSGNVSYGLPIGGNASRILSELVLHSTDRLLVSAGYTYCRYSDDYRIFVDSEDAGYSAMIQLAEFLSNQGLVLQKSKTQVIRTTELLQRIQADPDQSEGDLTPAEDTPSEQARRTFFGLSLRYDPYSPNADENYAELKAAIGQIDLVGMLADEVQKSRVSIPFTRRLIRAIRLLEEPDRSAAAEMLLANMQALSPVIPNVLITLKDLMPDLAAGTRDSICRSIRQNIAEESYAFQLNVNVAYAVRVLAELQDSENEAALVALYGNSSTSFVKRDVILAMTRWGHDHWISLKKTEFPNMSPPERRAFIVASYELGDEGRHWRQNVKETFSRSERMIRDWASRKKSSDPTWKVPI